MSYLVLARKWRPRSFETLVGQDHVVKALSNALTSQRLHHAWLFTGTRGVGKTTLARILAKSLNCEQGISATPCGVCQACTEIDEGRFPDYLEFDAASNRRVEEMTQLLEQAIYAPSVGRFKIYTIDEVHMLTGHAFNAMLKTLEEPPPHVKFILATTDPQKIPVTVLSRCLQFNLKQMAPESIVGHLQNVLSQEAVQFELEGLRLLAQAAAGSMRDALSLTDQAIAYSGSHITGQAVRDMLGTIDQRYLVRFLEYLLAGSAQGVVAVADELSTRGYSFSNALSDLASLLSQIAIEQRLPGTTNEADPACADIRQLAQTAHPDILQLFYSIALHSRAELALAPDEYTGFVMAGLRMLSLISSPQAQAVQALAPVNQAAVVAPNTEAEKKSPELSAPLNRELDPALNTESNANLSSGTISHGRPAESSANLSPETSHSIHTELSSTPLETQDATATVVNPLESAHQTKNFLDNVQPPEAVDALAHHSISTEHAPPVQMIDSESSLDSQPPVLDDERLGMDSEVVSLEVDDIPPWEDIPPASQQDYESSGEADLLVQEEDPSWTPLEREEHSYSLEQMNPELWVSVVPSLQLSGMVGELARHSEWLGVEGKTIHLRLLVRLPDNLQARNNLTTRLTEYFKTIVKVRFEFGQTGDATLHAQELAEQKARLEQAKQQLQDSPLVQSIVRDFDAMVVPDSIQAL